jgi:hypothetical protein
MILGLRNIVTCSECLDCCLGLMCVARYCLLGHRVSIKCRPDISVNVPDYIEDIFGSIEWAVNMLSTSGKYVSDIVGWFIVLA